MKYRLALVLALVAGAVWLWDDIPGSEVMERRFAAANTGLDCGGEFNDLYHEAVMAYWPHDWTHLHCWLSAQGWAESGYRTDVVSHAGAQGVAQFMAPTWKEVTRRHGIEGTPFEAGPAIDAQAAYMADLGSKWTAERSARSRLTLATASYNAGVGSIIRAQRYCVGARDWPEIRPCLVRVTGKHSEETGNYVDRIQRRFEEVSEQ